MNKKQHTEKTAPEEKLKYKVVTEFWDGAHLKNVGDTVFKTNAEAQYLVPHILEPVAPGAKPVPEKAPAKDAKPDLPKVKR